MLLDAAGCRVLDRLGVLGGHRPAEPRPARDGRRRGAGSRLAAVLPRPHVDRCATSTDLVAALGPAVERARRAGLATAGAAADARPRRRVRRSRLSRRRRPARRRRSRRDLRPPRAVRATRSRSAPVPAAAAPSRTPATPAGLPTSSASRSTSGTSPTGSPRTSSTTSSTEYAAGRTPNPCLRCNEQIKFAAVLDKALALGFDAVGTGHYARIVAGADGRAAAPGRRPGQGPVLRPRGPHRRVSSRRRCSRSATRYKDDVRDEAERRGLAVARKPDSHDICFIPDGDTAGFLRDRLGGAPGRGRRRRRRGARSRTTARTPSRSGSASGLRIGTPAADGRPRYVLDISPVDRTVTVGPREALAVTHARRHLGPLARRSVDGQSRLHGPGARARRGRCRPSPSRPATGVRRATARAHARRRHRAGGRALRRRRGSSGPRPSPAPRPDSMVRARPWADGTATGVGSMPGTDVREAVRIVLGELPDLPHLPELPDRGPGADLTGRGLGLLVDLHADVQPSGWRVADGAGRDERRAGPSCGEDLDALEELAEGYVGPLKIQVAGPWTLASTLELPHGDKALADPGACRDLAASLAEGLAAARRRRPPPAARRRACRPARRAGAARRPRGHGPDRQRVRPAPRSVEPAAAEELPDRGARQAARRRRARLSTAARRTSRSRCSRRAGADAFSLDLRLAARSGRSARRREQSWATALEAGVGLVRRCRADRRSVGELSDPAATVEPVRTLWRRLGLTPEALARVVVTPTCGLAGASPGPAVRAALAAARAGGSACWSTTPRAALAMTEAEIPADARGAARAARAASSTSTPTATTCSTPRR